MHVLESIIRTSDDGMYARLAFFMSTVTDELSEELAELDEFQVRAFMFQIGQVIAWIGHGDNDQLPESVRDFAEMVQPSEHTHDNDSEPDITVGTDS